MNKLDREKLTELCSLYQDYLAECEAYDGASFWSNKVVQEVEEELNSQIKQTILKAIVEKSLKTEESHDNCSCNQCMYVRFRNRNLDEFESVIKEVLK